MRRRRAGRNIFADLLEGSSVQIFDLLVWNQEDPHEAEFFNVTKEASPSYDEEEDDLTVIIRPEEGDRFVSSSHLQHTNRGKFRIGRLGFKNFGFEFDPAWIEEFERRWVPDGQYDKKKAFFEIYLRHRKKTTALDHFLEHLGAFKEGFESVWLIDYRLEPTARFIINKVANGQQRRRVFNALRRHFVEVKEKDVTTRLSPMDDSHPSHLDPYLWMTNPDYWETAVDGKMVRKDIFTFQRYVIDFLDELGRSWTPENKGPKLWFRSDVNILGCVVRGG